MTQITLTLSEQEIWILNNLRAVNTQRPGLTNTPEQNAFRDLANKILKAVEAQKTKNPADA